MLGRSNFHATPILDLQFRPPTNSLLISSDSISGRNIALLNLSLSMFLYLPSFARMRSFQGTPYYPFLCHSRFIYIPVSFWLVLSIRSPASQSFAAQSLLYFFVFVSTTILGDPWKKTTSSRWQHYGEREQLLRRFHRQRAMTAASSRKSFIKFLITEIIVIEIELWRMMFAWTSSKSEKQWWR